MHTGTVDRRAVADALELAARAPSVHNSQPWWWRVGDRVVQLYADLDRWLPVTDPDGRDLLLSCGAALHHLRVALAATGIGATVRRLPDDGQTDLLAVLALRPRGGGVSETGIDPDQARAIPSRRTERRNFRNLPVSRRCLDELASHAGSQGAQLRVVRDPSTADTLRLAIRTAAVDHAVRPDYADELARWNSLDAADDGVPAANVPAASGSLGRHTDAPVPRGHDARKRGRRPATPPRCSCSAPPPTTGSRACARVRR